jgi:branched-chain amino acid transport system substrate-binding protein
VLGDHARQGIRLAMQEAAQADFSIGGRPVQVLHPAYPVEEPPNLQPEAVRLLTVDQVSAILGGLDLDQARALGRAAQPHGTALLTGIELPPERVADNVFSVNVGMDFEARVLARFVRQELKAERTAILGDSRRLASTQLAGLLKQELAAQKIPVVLSLAAKGDADWPDVLARLQAASIQVLIYCGEGSELGRLRTRLKAAMLKPALVLAGAGPELELLRTDPEIGQAIYAAVPFVAEAKVPESEGFVRKYGDQFGEPPDTAAALAYDGIRALLEALRRGADPSPERVQSTLAELTSATPLSSVTGPYIFSNSHAARRPLFVVQVDDDKLARPKRYDPENEAR